MNIYDISKVAGVSIASVSRVINGAENVSEKTRKKVLDVTHQYRYTPNANARGLGRGSMKSIGITCSDPTDMYLASAINFLETELRSQGYNSILCCTGFELENKKASFELLNSRQDDAFVLDFYFAHKDDDVKTLVHAVMTNTEFWGQELTEIAGFEEATVQNLTLIREQGAKAAYASVL